MSPAPMSSTAFAQRSPGTALLEQYTAVRRQTEALCEPLSAEDHCVQSMPDASPAKWHLAHTTWFFETFILTHHLRSYRPLDERYRWFFNSYYNAVGDRPLRDMRGVFSRPAVEEVHAYRRHVDQGMRALLTGPPPAADVCELVELGLNHEQQHQELIVTDVKHALASNPLHPVYRSQVRAKSHPAAPLRWHEYAGGLVSIGHDGAGFGFDNEFPRHTVYLQPYRLASRLVSNAEYMEFMREGGYRRAELWLSDAWEIVRTEHWQAPLYWEEHDGSWQAMTLAGLLPVDPNEPVCHVSYYEADAYARWAGARLPREAEWESAAAGVAIEGNFLESEALHPRPENETSAAHPHQLYGDCWEWTASAYAPYPGYRPTEGALGEYNAKFMCNQMVLRGGSCATPRSHLRASYRNFFPPAARWQFSGIRLAQDE